MQNTTLLIKQHLLMYPYRPNIKGEASVHLKLLADFYIRCIFKYSVLSGNLFSFNNISNQ